LRAKRSNPEATEKVWIASAFAPMRFGGLLPGEARVASVDGSSLSLPCANALRLSQAMAANAVIESKIITSLK
jgi:hypothetical protein